MLDVELTQVLLILHDEHQGTIAFDRVTELSCGVHLTNYHTAL